MKSSLGAPRSTACPPPGTRSNTCCEIPYAVGSNNLWGLTHCEGLHGENRQAVTPTIISHCTPSALLLRAHYFMHSLKGCARLTCAQADQPNSLAEGHPMSSNLLSPVHMLLTVTWPLLLGTSQPHWLAAALVLAPLSAHMQVHTKC